MLNADWPLAHREKESVDPLNLDQWEFYVVPTSQLDSYQRRSAFNHLEVAGAVVPDISEV
ncbi:MAG: hypothetical protein ACM3SW_08475 [Actinomycetota bacterium]